MAVVMGALLHEKPVSAMNLESIFTLWFNLPYFILQTITTPLPLGCSWLTQSAKSDAILKLRGSDMISAT
jgi:hypothetical protein